jgi:hypothetical protein
MTVWEREIAVKVLRKKKATKVEEIRDITHVYLYNTCIVSIFPNVVRFRTGGYYTVTTKRRMNEVCKLYKLPLCIKQKDFTWYVTGKDILTVNFKDGFCEVPNSKRA